MFLRYLRVCNGDNGYVSLYHLRSVTFAVCSTPTQRAKNHVNPWSSRSERTATYYTLGHKDPVALVAPVVFLETVMDPIAGETRRLLSQKGRGNTVSATSIRYSTNHQICAIADGIVNVPLLELAEVERSTFCRREKIFYGHLHSMLPGSTSS